MVETTVLVQTASMCLMPPAISRNKRCNKNQIPFCIWTDKSDFIMNAAPCCWQYSPDDCMEGEPTELIETLTEKQEYGQKEVSPTFKSIGRRDFKMGSIFTFHFSVSVFSSVLLFPTHSFLYDLCIPCWNVGKALVYTCMLAEQGIGVACHLYVMHIYIALRNYSVRHVTWPHSDLRIMQNQKRLNVKCWGVSEPSLPGWSCIFGAAERAEGGDAVGWTVESVTYCPKHCDSDEQKQVSSEVQCRALQKTCHHWSEREGNTAGDAMVRGDGCGVTSHTTRDREDDGQG